MKRSRFLSQQPNQSSAQRSSPRSVRRVRLAVEELENRVVPTTDLFLVPGDPNTQVPITFHWDASNAAWQNELGVYMTDANGVVNGQTPGSAQYAITAINPGSVVFPRGTGPGTERTMLFAGGTHLAFFLITNDASSTWTGQNSTNRIGAGPLAYFSVDKEGPNGWADQWDPVISQQNADGSSTFFFTDGGPGSQHPYQDMIFTVSQAPSRAFAIGGANGQLVGAQFNLLSQKGAFHNELGLFLVDNAQGKIGTMFPGDPGYAFAALSSPNRLLIFAPGQTTGALSQLQLPAGKFVGFYLIQNATTAQWFASNPDNITGNGPVAFFTFPELNPDLLNHFRDLGNNTFGVEDQTHLGDADFSDIVFHFNFGSVPTIAVGLQHDTPTVGGTPGDKVTFDATIAGTVTSAARIVDFRAGFDNTAVGNFVSVLDQLQANGTFVFDQNELNKINGGVPLTPGPHTLHLRATDEQGNVTNIVDFTFTFKATTLDLNANDNTSDTGVVGDHITSAANVSLVGVTEPGATVVLTGGNLPAGGVTQTSLATDGSYNFTNVALPPGVTTFTVNVSDANGHTATTSVTITRPILDLDPSTDSGKVGDHITNIATVNLVGSTTPGAMVALEGTNMTTTADASGNYAFNGITLKQGANTFTVDFTVNGNTTKDTETFTLQPPNLSVSTIPAMSVAANTTTPTVVDLAKFFASDASSPSQVTFTTNSGTLMMQLFDTDAPATVANFLDYVKATGANGYTSSIFHRLVPGFVIQGGGFQFTAGPPADVNPITADSAIPSEANAALHPNTAGTLAMALSGTPSNPSTATDEFFINLANNAKLDDPTQGGPFTVFGTLVHDNTATMSSLTNATVTDATKLNTNAKYGALTDLPLKNYNGSNFPTDTTAANYDLVSSLSVTRQTEQLTYTATSSNPALVTVPAGTLPNEKLKLTFVSGQTGTSTITVTSTSKYGPSISTTFTVTVG